jgi:hypothetical protein
VGEFEAVTESSAGGENRIPQAQRANFYAEVHGASGSHFVQKDNMKSSQAYGHSGLGWCQQLRTILG